MDNQAQQIQANLAQVQALIDQYHALRSQTNAFINRLPPEQQNVALAALQKWRDPATEEQALRNLRDVLASIYGRDPSPAEMQRGLRFEQGLSGAGLTTAAGVTLVLAGLVALSGIYQSLFGRESYLQQELGITSASSLRSSLAKAGMWAAVAGAVGYGSYKLSQKLAKKK